MVNQKMHNKKLKYSTNIMHVQYVPILKSIAQESFGVRWVPIWFIF